MSDLSSSEKMLQCILAGEYKAGIDLFNSVETPCAEMKRWMAICCLNDGQTWAAYDFALSAILKGAIAAKIELATIYRFMGNEEMATEALDSISVDKLQRLDKILYMRERGALCWRQGDLSTALQILERACLESLSLSQFPILIASIRQLVGAIRSDLGHFKIADQHFAYAMMHANTPRRAYILINRAASMIYRGNFSGALELWKAAKFHSSAVPVILPLLLYYRGILARTQGKFKEADNWFSEATKESSAVAETETANYSILMRAVNSYNLSTSESDKLLFSIDNMTEAHLKPHILWAKGVLFFERDRSMSIKFLLESRDIFKCSRRMREAAWLNLWLAEAYFSFDQEQQGDDELAKALNAWTNTNDIGIFSEIRALELTRKAIVRHGCNKIRDITFFEHETKRPCILLKLNGRAAIELNAQSVGLRLSGSLEIIIYLHYYGPSTIDTIHMALAPDKDSSLFKSYFHQCRTEVKRKVSGMEVVYDSKSKKYTITTTGADFSIDVEEFFSNLLINDEIDKSMVFSDLMRDWSADWATLLRHKFESRLSEYFNSNSYKAINSRRLFFILTQMIQSDPLNDILHQWYLKYCAHLEGHQAAREYAKRTSALYHKLYGYAPMWLEDECSASSKD